MEKIYENIACGRCNGSGTFYWATFQGHDSGDCFKCGGTGLVKVRVFSDEHRAKLDAQKAKRAAKAAEATRLEFAYATEAAAEMATLNEIKNASFAHLDVNVGDAVEVEGVISGIVPVETQFGSSLLIFIRVDFEHEVKTFTSANWAYSANVGDKVTARGTVKALDEYKGRKATQLTRVKAA
jgi:hypothetical protein